MRHGTTDQRRPIHPDRVSPTHPHIDIPPWGSRSLRATRSAWEFAGQMQRTENDSRGALAYKRRDLADGADSIQESRSLFRIGRIDHVIGENS